MQFPKPCERGCGTREEGGVYLECGLAEDGVAVETYVMDPPRPFDDVSEIGVKLVEGPDGLVHVLDYIGQSHYPWPSDVIEEGRQHGFSRRIPKTLDLSPLSKGSRMIFVHARGKPVDNDALDPFWTDESLHNSGKCARFVRCHEDVHLDKPVSCSRLHYALAEPTEWEGSRALAGGGTGPTRKVGDTVYNVCPPEKDVREEAIDEVEFERAIIASVPITSVAVIESGDDSHIETAQEKCSEFPSIPLHVEPK